MLSSMFEIALKHNWYLNIVSDGKNKFAPNVCPEKKPEIGRRQMDLNPIYVIVYNANQ